MAKPSIFDSKLVIDSIKEISIGGGIISIQ